jgi:hypothetical protein
MKEANTQTLREVTEDILEGQRIEDKKPRARLSDHLSSF